MLFLLPLPVAIMKSPENWISEVKVYYFSHYGLRAWIGLKIAEEFGKMIQPPIFFSLYIG